MSMFNISTLHGTSRKAFLTFIEIVVVVVSLSFLTMVYRTFGDIPAPMILNEPAIVASMDIKNDKGESIGYEVHISREVVYNDITPTTLSTILFHTKTKATIALQDIRITPDEIGTEHSHRLYFVKYIKHGEWCMRSYVYWTPFLSLRERSTSTKEACFFVE